MSISSSSSPLGEAAAKKAASVLAELVTRRRQVVNLQTMETSRLETTVVKAVRRSIEKVLKLLNRELGQLDAGIARLIQADES